MVHLIDKDAVLAEIARQKAQWRICKSSEAKYRREMLDDISSFIDTLEVKEVEENKLPNPRFPHLNNIVDKVFGTGNLESLEYEEAEQLVLLAKEELLKDLEVKEVDLEKEYKKYVEEDPVYNKLVNGIVGKSLAKHFFELALSLKNN